MHTQVVIRRYLESELDEMWSYVDYKSQQRWLWHAIDHHSGKVLAYVFGHSQEPVFQELRSLLKPFGISHYYTDDWGVYERHIKPEHHHVGKRNTQKIEPRSGDVFSTAFAAGPCHDKTLATRQPLRLDQHTHCGADLGYQGLAQVHALTWLPVKASKQTPPA